MENKIEPIRINTDLSIDPDFGKDVPEFGNMYYIIVTPKSHNYSWSFYIFLPKFSESVDEFQICHDLCVRACEDGDNARIHSVDEETATLYDKSYPLIIYHNNDFVWLKPPKLINH